MRVMPAARISLAQPLLREGGGVRDTQRARGRSLSASDLRTARGHKARGGLSSHHRVVVSMRSQIGAGRRGDRAPHGLVRPARGGGEVVRGRLDRERVDRRVKVGEVLRHRERIEDRPLRCNGSVGVTARARASQLSRGRGARVRSQSAHLLRRHSHVDCHVARGLCGGRGRRRGGVLALLHRQAVRPEQHRRRRRARGSREEQRSGEERSAEHDGHEVDGGRRSTTVT